MEALSVVAKMIGSPGKNDSLLSLQICFKYVLSVIYYVYMSSDGPPKRDSPF